MGVVCRDSEGRVVWCAAEFAMEAREWLLAETMAMCWALVIAKAMGARRIVMER